MNDYTPAQYFLSIISYQVAGATERFLLFDSNNDTTGAIPKKITKKKKKKASYRSTYYHSEILGNNTEAIIKYPNNFPTRTYQIINRILNGLHTGYLKKKKKLV